MGVRAHHRGGLRRPRARRGDRKLSQVRASRRPARAGARVLGEVWSHPRENLLLHATTIAGSSRGHVWSRLAAGFRAWQNVYVGPEAALYRTATYHEGRLGLHATGVEFGSFAVRVSGGWRWDEERDRSGPYVGLSGHWRP